MQGGLLLGLHQVQITVWNAQGSGACVTAPSDDLQMMYVCAHNSLAYSATSGRTLALDRLAEMARPKQSATMLNAVPGMEALVSSTYYNKCRSATTQH